MDRPDVVIGTCVHPLAPLTAYLLSRKHNGRFFYEVTDLWPQSLIDMGAIGKKHPVAIGLRFLEKFLFKRSEKIISILPNIQPYVKDLGLDQDKVEWIPNSVNIKHFQNIVPSNRDVSQGFKISYLGGLSAYQGLEHILYAAAKVIQISDKIYALNLSEMDQKNRG